MWYISDTSIVSSGEQPFLVGIKFVFILNLAVPFIQKPDTKNPLSTTDHIFLKFLYYSSVYPLTKLQLHLPITFEDYSSTN